MEGKMKYTLVSLRKCTERGKGKKRKCTKEKS